MKFAIKHEIKGRIRIHLAQKRMTYRQADILQCYLEDQANISKATVYVRTQDIAVTYTGSRDDLIRLLSRFSYETAQVAESALENSGRELNETYKEKLINSISGTCSDHNSEISEVHLPRCTYSDEGQTESTCSGCDSNWRIYAPR